MQHRQNSSAEGKEMLSTAEILHGFDVSGLPENFVTRLVIDSQGGPEYRRIRSVSELRTQAPNSSHCGACCATSLFCCCCDATLVEDGRVGLFEDDGAYAFLAPGYHRFAQCGTSYTGARGVAVVDEAVTNGTLGFLTVSEANVGVIQVGAAFKLLAPGTYEWQSPRVRFVTVASLTQNDVRLGPYRLLTVPRGHVAVTYNNGELVILGGGEDDIAAAAVPMAAAAPPTNPIHGQFNAAGGDDTADADDAFQTLLPGSTVTPAEREPIGDRAATSGPNAAKSAATDNGRSRTYFLENAKWTVKGLLPTVTQTDRLEGNDLLSKDNVEVLMVAMAHWRIRDPARAVTNCADTMGEVRGKVNQLVRATIARIVAGTCIGAGPVSGATAAHSSVVVATATSSSGDGDADLAHLMKSSTAAVHMAELTLVMDQMGIEVCGVYVPEKRMKNDDIRREVATQAVIGIKAEAERAAADATAYATVKAARAEAEAIELLAKAHADAGERLGGPESTAARLALSETMAKALKDTNMTVFSGAPHALPFMFSAPPAGGRGSTMR